MCRSVAVPIRALRALVVGRGLFEEPFERGARHVPEHALASHRVGEQGIRLVGREVDDVIRVELDVVTGKRHGSRHLEQRRFGERVGEDHAVEFLTGRRPIGTEDRLGHRGEVWHDVDGRPETPATTELIVVLRVVLVGWGTLPSEGCARSWIGTNGEKWNRPSSTSRIE